MAFLKYSIRARAKKSKIAQPSKLSSRSRLPLYASSVSMPALSFCLWSCDLLLEEEDAKLMSQGFRLRFFMSSRQLGETGEGLHENELVKQSTRDSKNGSLPSC
jgi:hypothetical protein